MRCRREIPRDMDPDPSDENAGETGNQYQFVGQGVTRPDNEWEALLTAPPHTEPEISREERLPLRDVIADALDQLTDEERWVFDALVVRKLSLRQLGRELAISKSSVARHRDQTYARLRELLSAHPTVRSYLNDVHVR